MTDETIAECRHAFDEYWARKPAMMTLGELWHAAWDAGQKAEREADRSSAGQTGS